MCVGAKIIATHASPVHRPVLVSQRYPQCPWKSPAHPFQRTPSLHNISHQLSCHFSTFTVPYPITDLCLPYIFTTRLVIYLTATLCIPDGWLSKHTGLVFSKTLKWQQKHKQEYIYTKTWNHEKAALGGQRHPTHFWTIDKEEWKRITLAQSDGSYGSDFGEE